MGIPTNKDIWAMAFGCTPRLLATAGMVAVIALALFVAPSLVTKSNYDRKESNAPRKNLEVEYEAFSCMSGPWNTCSSVTTHQNGASPIRG